MASSEWRIGKDEEWLRFPPIRHSPFAIRLFVCLLGLPVWPALTTPTSPATRRISSRSRRCRFWRARPRSIRTRSRSSTARGRGPIGEFYARARRLGSALQKRGIKRGDTVAAVLPNVPAMLEAHYGVAMAGAVLNTINTRLDAAIVAFHARPRRGQGADRRSRIFQGGARRAGGLQGQAAGDRL